MPNFFVADLSVQGELREVTEYDGASLERISCAADLIHRCSEELSKNCDTFEAALTDDGRTLLRWRATGSGTGVLTVRTFDGELVSLSVLAASNDTDPATFMVLQQHLVRQLHQTPYEPAFDLIGLKQRPVLATITFICADDADHRMVRALADRTFAAAYFRHLGVTNGPVSDLPKA